ncbi:hypothetical protein M91_07936, partial [Bos mutus]
RLEVGHYASTKVLILQSHFSMKWKLVAMTFSKCPKASPPCFYSFWVVLMYLLLFNIFNLLMFYPFFPFFSSIIHSFNILHTYSKISTAHRINPMILNVGLKSKSSTPNSGTWSWFLFSTLSSVSLVLLFNGISSKDKDKQKYCPSKTKVKETQKQKR